VKKRLLIVAFEFLPSNGASVSRIMSIYHTFIKEGWIVDVLTSSEAAYDKIQPMKVGDISQESYVMRTKSIDASKKLSIKGKYLGAFCIPDKRGLTWIPSSLVEAGKYLKEHKPDLIWSSSPIPSAHYVASVIAKKSKAKWFADIRDPSSYIIGRSTESPLFAVKKIDDIVKKNADAIFFATDGIKKLYLDGTSLDKKCFVMENGYIPMERTITERENTNSFRDGYLSIFYAGDLYDDGRDPKPIFKALSQYLMNDSSIKIEIVFRGAGDGAKFKDYILNLNLGDNILFKESVSFEQSIAEMNESDLLLLIQDELFNNQVPGKIYEYLATGKPVIVKSPLDSQTSEVAKKHDGTLICYSELEIRDAIATTCENKKNGRTSYQRDLSQHNRILHAMKVVKMASEKLNTEEISNV